MEPECPETPENAFPQTVQLLAHTGKAGDLWLAEKAVIILSTG